MQMVSNEKNSEKLRTKAMYVTIISPFLSIRIGYSCDRRINDTKYALAHMVNIKVIIT